HSGGLLYALDDVARTEELRSFGFEDVEHEAVHWTLELDGTRTRWLDATFSNDARLPESRRETILDELQCIAQAEFGGRVERLLVTPISTARRQAVSAGGSQACPAPGPSSGRAPGSRTSRSG